MRGETLTIYSSGPRHGVSAAAGQAAFAGQRRALEDAGGRAGGRRIRLVRLANTRPGDLRWDPGTVKANADRARRDPSAIAYLGELDSGGSAISLPVTNRANLLQVSPTDGLTSLTRRPPGRPRAGPERYYPRGRRTFARLVPSDMVVAAELASQLRARNVRRVAILTGDGSSDAELTAVLANRLRATGREPVFAEIVPDDRGAVPGLVGELGETRPDAVVLLAMPTEQLKVALQSLARRQPGVAVLGTAGLAAVRLPPADRPRLVEALTPVLPAEVQPPAGRRMLHRLSEERGAPARPEALYGFEAMRLVLRAIDAAGPDRRAVVRAALAPQEDQTLLGNGARDGAGDVRTTRLGLMRFRGAEPTFVRLLR